MSKYIVKENCCIMHEDKLYIPGDEIELNEELALFHAPNIRVKPPDISISQDDDSGKP